VDERIWALPGPRTLISDALDEINRGRHVCVVLPASMAEDPAITDTLAGGLIDEINRTAMTCRINPEPGEESLLAVLARAVDLDDPPATVPELLRHYQAADTVFIAVAAEFTAQQQKEFPDLLQRLERETHSVPRTDRLSLIVVAGRQHLPQFAGGESSDVSLASVWWWHRIARWDTAAHISHVAPPRREARILSDVRTETIVEVARWDLVLAERLAHDWSGDPEDLPEHLTPSAAAAAALPAEVSEGCGAAPADALLELWDRGRVDGWHDLVAPSALTLAATPHRLARVVWAAQARIVLPWIEQRREVLQDRAVEKMGRKRFHAALQNLFREPVTDNVVEISHLRRIIDIRIGDVPMRSAANWLYDARNKLAHLRPLKLGELRELVTACRDFTGN
jgi:hypothetical protein